MRIFQAFTRWPVNRFKGVFAPALTVVLALSAAVPVVRTASASDDVSAHSYIVIDDKTGRIFAGAHADDKVQVASLTKIATAVVVLDWARLSGHTLDQSVPISATATAEGGLNPVGFMPGDEVSVRDLLYAALLQSDNVAADALAEFVGHDLKPGQNAGRVDAGPTVFFVAQMNALARQLKMERTRFLNPSGLDTKERPFSTAADLARLTRHALAKADFRFFIAQKERRITINRAGAPSQYLLRNTNELLGSHGIDGVKTGQTARAGECLIITAARDPIVVENGPTSQITPRRLIVVVLGSSDRFRVAAQLLERGIGLFDSWASTGYPADAAQTLQ